MFNPVTTGAQVAAVVAVLAYRVAARSGQPELDA